MDVLRKIHPIFEKQDRLSYSFEATKKEFADIVFTVRQHSNPHPSMRRLNVSDQTIMDYILGMEEPIKAFGNIFVNVGATGFVSFRETMNGATTAFRVLSQGDKLDIANPARICSSVV